MGWLASLTLEDEARQELSLPRVVYEYEGVFSDELRGLPQQNECRLHYLVTPWYIAYFYDTA